jgi:hypothetical protein
MKKQERLSRSSVSVPDQFLRDVRGGEGKRQADTLTVVKEYGATVPVGLT